MSSVADFDEFYAATGPSLTGQVYLLTGNREEARDCVQEAMERAWLRQGTVSRMAAPAAWVRVVATRLATSRWRKARNAMTAGLRAHRDERAPDRAGEVLTRTVLVEALQQLSPKQRAAIVLHHLCDLDIASVAEETGCTESAVKSQLFKGRQRLAAHLAEAGYPTLAAFTEENP